MRIEKFDYKNRVRRYVLVYWPPTKMMIFRVRAFLRISIHDNREKIETNEWKEKKLKKNIKSRKKKQNRLKLIQKNHSEISIFLVIVEWGMGGGCWLLLMKLGQPLDDKLMFIDLIRWFNGNFNSPAAIRQTQWLLLWAVAADKTSSKSKKGLDKNETQNAKTRFFNEEEVTKRFKMWLSSNDFPIAKS